MSTSWLYCIFKRWKTSTPKPCASCTRLEDNFCSSHVWWNIISFVISSSLSSRDISVKTNGCSYHRSKYFWYSTLNPERRNVKKSRNMLLLNRKCKEFSYRRVYRCLPNPKSYQKRPYWGKHLIPVESLFETLQACHLTMQYWHALLNSTRTVSASTDTWLWQPEAEFWSQLKSSSLNFEELTSNLTRSDWIASRIDIIRSMKSYGEGGGMDQQLFTRFLTALKEALHLYIL